MQCPNCEHAELRPFYSLRDIPAQSCVLLPTREAALAIPRGDIELGLCERCGFICNMTFDEARATPEADYEDAQGFSMHFNAFAESLADRLIESHQLRGRQVVEIGCGKGEFLSLLVRRGAGFGIGIDPLGRADRIPDDVADRITMIPQRLSPEHALDQGGLMCCRHTLEHIPDTRRFAELMRSVIGRRDDVAVFIEVPSMMRILRTGAFWDIYYEHCSYFTAGSLQSLLTATGFKVIGAELAYDQQYLLMMAEPTEEPASDLPSPDVQWRDVQQFIESAREQVHAWTSCIQERSDAGRRVVLWGSGSKAVGFLATTGLADEIEYVVDINPHKHGKFMPGGQQIIAPAFLAEYQPHDVLVMNPVYCSEIQASLDQLDVEAALVPVGQ